MAVAIDGRGAIRAFVEHEHTELTAGVDRMHELARDLSNRPASELIVVVGDVLRWIDETLRPHMAWEEGWLFPQIDAQAHTPWATRLVRFDHRQIARQAERLSSHRPDARHGPAHTAAVELRSDLLALESLVRANVEREEEFLLPMLESAADRWTAEWQD
jgi:iron-sulfur cluster repair protein YtfE (RIC family)